MKTTDVLAVMRKGEILCKGHAKDGPEYWLHPSRLMVPADIAEAVIGLPGIEPGKDGLSAISILTNSSHVIFVTSTVSWAGAIELALSRTITELTNRILFMRDSL